MSEAWPRAGKAAAGDNFLAGGPGSGLASSVVKPLTEPEIRAAFVNCSKGEAKRASIPRDLSGQPWEDLDFLGWRDPQSPERAYLAAEVDGKAASRAILWATTCAPTLLARSGRRVASRSAGTIFPRKYKERSSPSSGSSRPSDRTGPCRYPGRPDRR